MRERTDVEVDQGNLSSALVMDMCHVVSLAESYRKDGGRALQEARDVA
jgi:hypothetical protein